METGERQEEQAAREAPRRPCLCETYARVTERAALAGARWLGRDDQEAAEDAAFSGARHALEVLPITGHIVIGGHEGADQLAVGTTIGAGGEEVDLALDPLEGRGVTARGGNNAISMIAVGPRGSMPSLPDMYMRKMAVGPRARGKISLAQPVGDNIRAIADAFGRMVNDVTTIVLDRPRHHDLIEEIRAAGARIKLIQDGDVLASISAAVRGTNDHLAVGIGGTRQAVLAAAALRCLGGELQAQLWPTRRAEIEDGARARHRRHRPDLHDRRPRAAGGDRRRDRRVERRAAARRPLPRRLGARTHSLVMCTRCNWVRFVDGDPLLRARAPRRGPVDLREETAGFGVEPPPRRACGGADLMPYVKEEVVEALRQVEDPELGMDIVELGLFYDAEIEGAKVKVTYTLTSMGCPVGPMIMEDIDRVVRADPGRRGRRASSSRWTRRGRPSGCPKTRSSSSASGRSRGGNLRVPPMSAPSDTRRLVLGERRQGRHSRQLASQSQTA